MTPTIATIRRAVAEAAGITEAELLSDSRERAVALPRQVAMYLARQVAAATVVEIGVAIGRHHTTVMHGVEAVGNRLLWGCPRTIGLVNGALETLGYESLPHKPRAVSSPLCTGMIRPNHQTISMVWR